MLHKLSDHRILSIKHLYWKNFDGTNFNVHFSTNAPITFWNYHEKI